METPRPIINADGTPNGKGTLTRYTELLVSHNGKEEKQQFYIADLGTDRIILGFPWLREWNPDMSRAKLAPTRNALPNDPRTHSTIRSHFHTAPNPSSNQVNSRTRDHGNLPHDLSRDPSHDLSVSSISRDLTARDPGNITHDQPRNWSSSMSQDYTRFRYATRPLINTWKTVGRIHKHVTVDQSTKTRLIGVTPQ